MRVTSAGGMVIIMAHSHTEDKTWISDTVLKGRRAGYLKVRSRTAISSCPAFDLQNFEAFLTSDTFHTVSRQVKNSTQLPCLCLPWEL